MILKFYLDGNYVVYDEVVHYSELGITKLMDEPSEGFTQKDIGNMYDEFKSIFNNSAIGVYGNYKFVDSLLMSENEHICEFGHTSDSISKFSRQFNIIRFRTTYEEEHNILFNEHCYVCNNKGETIGKIQGQFHDKAKDINKKE